VVGQRPDSLVTQAGDVIDAETIQAIDNTYGVWFQITIPMTLYVIYGQEAAAGGGTPGLNSAAQVVVSTYAGFINALGGMAEVTDMYYLQGVSRGLFIDQLVVEVGTADLTSTAEVVVKLDPNNQANAQAQVTTLYNAMVAALATT
jgi:hypothetical protein